MRHIKIRVGLIVAYFVANILPRSIQRKIGEKLGGFLLKRIRKKGIARKNIELCYPQFSKDQVNQLIQENATNLGVATIDWCISWFWPDQKIKKHFPHRIEGLEFLQQGDGKGVLLLLKHSQHFMLDMRVLGAYHELCAMTNDWKHSSYLNKKYQKARSQACKGGTALPSESLKLLRWLKKGKTVLYAPDHDYGLKHSIIARFFGVPTATIKAPFKIKKATNCHICLVDSFYDGDKKLVIKIAELKHLDDSSQENFLQQMNDAISKDITKHPAEYSWQYNRFKSMNVYEVIPLLNMLIYLIKYRESLKISE